MRRRGHITAFYVETLLMIVVMIGILMVLTGVFGYSRSESVRAKRLTEAVTVAESAAEALAASDDFADFTDHISLEDANLQISADGSGKLTGYYQWERLSRPDKISVYRVEVVRTMQEDGFCLNTISVFYKNENEPVYTLDTSRYLPDAGEEAGSL